MITRELLQKYLEGRCTPEELAFLNACFERGGTKELDRILDEDWEAEGEGAAVRNDGFSRRRIWRRLAEDVYCGEDGQPEEGSSRGVFRRGIMTAAATLCLAVLAGFMFWRNNRQVVQPAVAVAQGTIERKNDTRTVMTVHLPDGSKVRLEPRSSLRYPPRFEGGKRVVRLEGKAFFEVTKDSLHPFFVKTRALRVKVLGTSFNVSSFRDEPAEVSVLTGRVAVFAAGLGGSLVLKPNERVVRRDGTSGLAKMLVAEPVLVRPEVLTNVFDFDEAPVASVFSVLEKAYNVRIVFDQAALRRCTLKARLDDQPLFVKLEMICASMGLTYRVSGTEILITGAGC